MKKIGFLFLFALFVLFTSTASATVLTFDDIAVNPNSTHGIYNGYGGFNWTDVHIIHENYHPGSGYANGVVSGNWAAFNAYDRIATVNNTVFDFNGAFFTSAWDPTNYITAIGYLDNSEIYRSTYQVNQQTPTWLQFDFLGIDTLTLNSSGSHFAMDNFTFNETAPVPEPATLFLLGSGVLGMIVSKKRKK